MTKGVDERRLELQWPGRGKHEQRGPASLLTRVWLVVTARRGSGASLVPSSHPDFALAVSTLRPPRQKPTMSIAPITGKLRKRFWLDLTTALGLGVSAGYAFWSVSPVFLLYASCELNSPEQVWRAPQAW